MYNTDMYYSCDCTAACTVSGSLCMLQYNAIGQFKPAYPVNISIRVVINFLKEGPDFVLTLRRYY